MTRLLSRLALLLLVIPAAAQTPVAPCALGYTVGFFNGVFNTELEAIDGRNATQAAIHETLGVTDDTYQHEDVSYQLFYNHTGRTAPGYTTTRLQDIAEVFIQRANTLDPTYTLSGQNFYLFWEPFYGQPPAYANSTASASPTFNTFFNEFVTDVIGATVTELSYVFSNPPTTQDYATQQATLDTLAAQGRKFLLVAHSQGNLFLDPAYDHIQPVVGSTRVKAVHIAPASPTLRGNYLLSINDAVINGLRLTTGFNTVPAGNIVVPISLNDPSGHTYTGTYLDPAKGARVVSEGLFSGGLSALTAPVCPLSIGPVAVKTSPATSTTFTATITPPPADPALQTSYTWTVTGNAGGSFVNPAGGTTTSFGTLSPTVTYTSGLSATDQSVDTISVTAYSGVTLADPAKDVTLGTISTTATVSVGPGPIAPWLGTWTCPGGLLATGQNVQPHTDTFYAQAPVGPFNPPAYYTNLFVYLQNTNIGGASYYYLQYQGLDAFARGYGRSFDIAGTQLTDSQYPGQVCTR